MRTIFFILLLTCCIAKAETFAVETDKGQSALYPYVDFVEDRDHHLTFDAVMGLPENSWTHNKAEIFNKGYSEST